MSIVESALENNFQGSCIRVGIFLVGLTVLHFILATLVPLIRLASVQRLCSHLKTRNDLISLPAKIISSLHACAIAAGCAKAILWNRCFENRGDLDLMEIYPLDCEWIWPLYLAYTIYDLIVMAVQPMKNPRFMWGHHFIGLFSIVLLTYIRKGTFFPFVFVISEATVPFVNLVWAIDNGAVGDNDEATRKAVYIARFASAFLFRAFVAPASIYLAYVYSGSNWEALWISFSTKIPIPIAILTVLNVCVFGYFNIVWTYLMLKAIFKKRQRPKQN